jgi:23S rRNA (cytosine1962-C5)-methyltransferase
MRFPTITLKSGRERAVQRRHPWLFSGAITHVESTVEDGGLVDVFSATDEWLARGYFNSASQITVRLLSWEREQVIDVRFWQERMAQAISGRDALIESSETTAYRIVNAESDGLPGLVIDRYGDWLVLQALTLGIECRKEELANLAAGLLPGVRGVYERSDVDAREHEGLAPTSGVLWGEEPDGLVEVLENGYRFLVDVQQGHKTGFYLDQRESRGRIVSYGVGARVLNAFAYTGAFGVYALGAGAASVVNVDTSSRSLELARQQVARNGFEDTKVVYETDDVFSKLREYRALGRQFDLIILDPPAFATSRSHTKRAVRGYKDINFVAMQILCRGGVLFTFSCSGFVSRDLFQKIVFGAALDAERDVQIVGYLSQADDHPVALNFPEAAYLKGLICRVW